MVKTKIAPAAASGCVKPCRMSSPVLSAGVQTQHPAVTAQQQVCNLSSSKSSAAPVSEVSLVISFLAWGVACGSLEPPG